MRILSFLTFFVVIALYNVPLLASLKILEIRGASNHDLTTATSTPTVYAGVAGSDSLCSGSVYETCNNCTEAIVSCNRTRIFDDLILEISFQVDSLEDGTSGSVWAEIANSTSTSSDIQPLSTVTKYGNGDTAIIQLTWRSICTAYDATAGTCNDAAITTNLTIGLDADGNSDISDAEGGLFKIIVTAPHSNLPAITDADVINLCDNLADPVEDSGICDFDAFKGDEKVVLKTAEQTSKFPTSPSAALNFDRVRVLCSETGFTDANPTFPCADLTIASDSEGFKIDDRTIRELSNNVFYFFRVGVLDPANNLAYITSNTAIENACGLANSNAFDATDPTDADDDACRFIAKPERVFGLLTEDFSCFIATAAFGSPLHPRVRTFRKFRDKFLLSNEWGQKFVKLYYKTSPPWASTIAHRDGLRHMARIFLWPLWLFAWLSLQIGILGSLISFILITGVLAFIGLRLQYYWRKSRKSLKI